MNVLIVYAHPEPRSLNGSLKNFAVRRLEQAGHKVQVSDLYAMNWKPVVDGADFPGRVETERLDLIAESMRAFATETQPDDVTAEQQKLLWCDVLILQFPIWWFSMPAILKGWVDRVFACGFGFGVGEHSERKWGDRYGEGTLAGKRAMLVVTAGGWESHYAARGINGSMDDLLFPIQHGVLFYPGLEVLPPFVVYQTMQVDSPGFEAACTALGDRLARLQDERPIPFRKQNGGDYELPQLTLRSDIDPGAEGFAAHLGGR